MALSNTATHKLSSNERFISYILEGLGGEGIWGYGIHRVRVMASNKKDDTAIVRCTDGNENELYVQKIGYTDFPLEEIVLYCTNGIVLLPGEY